MATKYGNWVWEGQSTEIKPTYEEGAGDGHVFKELDTGESYTMVDGEWLYINLGLAFIKATKSGTIVTDENGDGAYTFSTPFIDANYTVALTCTDNDRVPIALVAGKTVTGFSIKTKNGMNNNIMGNVTVSWLATRDYDP